MFGLSISHILLLAVIALVVIGPKQLPEVARMLARFLNDLKRTTSEITDSISEARDSTNRSLLEKRNQIARPPAEINLKPKPDADPDPNQLSFDIHTEKSGNEQ